MIEKSTILITSIGRTGTEFFSKFLGDVIPDCTSLHEPNTIVLTAHIENRLERYIQQLQQAGIWRMVFLKALGKWNLEKLSDARLLGKLSYAQAVKNLCRQRMDFVSKLPGSVYIEANLGYYGVLDIMPAVFKNHRCIYIVRDGRDWIRSMQNWGEVYGKRGIRKYFSHRWPAASDLPNDPYVEEWSNFSHFEKLCWAWTKLNEYAIKTADQNRHAKIFLFEKIFSGGKRYEYLEELVTFASSLPDIVPGDIGRFDGWLEKKIHQSSEKHPSWKKWTSEQQRQFERLCGHLMERLGYEF